MQTLIQIFLATAKLWPAVNVASCIRSNYSIRAECVFERLSEHSDALKLSASRCDMKWNGSWRMYNFMTFFPLSLFVSNDPRGTMYDE